MSWEVEPVPFRMRHLKIIKKNLKKCGLASTVLVSGVLLLFRAVGNTEERFPISPGFTLSLLPGQWSRDLDHCEL